MVRTFLGNIQGPKGDPGDAADINEYGIGINNLFNMSDLMNYDDSGVNDANYRTGLITFENTAYYLRSNVYLTAGTYMVKVKDYSVAEGYYADRMRFNVKDAETSESSFSDSLEKDTPYTINVETDGEYLLELRMSGSDRATGFFEKVMFVKSDVIADWQPSIKDSSKAIDPTFMSTRALDTEIVYGVLHQLSFFGTEGDDLTSGNAIVLTKGLWDINWVYTLKDVVDEVVIYVFVNSSQIIRSIHNESGTVNLSTKINADDGDAITFSVRTASETSTMTFGQNVGENRMTVAKQ